MDTDKDPESLTRLARARLRAAAAGEKEARRQLAESEELLDAEIVTARELNIPWIDIAQDLGIPESKAKYRYHREDPAVQKNRERMRKPPEQHKARTGPRPGQGPGMNVTAFARKAGVTRKTVYNWIEAGKVEITRNELGMTRILSEPPIPENQAEETA